MPELVITKNQFQKILLEGVPFIDVRAPIEFAEGAIPGAVNFPLLNDEERQQIGICYKEHGQKKAIELGEKLISGEIKRDRLDLWKSFISKNPRAHIYCFRGGLRSKTVQAWLNEEGVFVPIIEGGYKALRNFLLENLRTTTLRLNFEVVAGLTGSGKTKYLYEQKEAPFIDLEGLACHKGSAFGDMECEQPNQVDFENRISLEFMKLQAKIKNSFKKILIENESRMIGKRTIPEVLFQKMKESPKRILEVSLDQRVQNIYEDYILNSSLGKNKNIDRFNDFEKSVHAITRKLGYERAQELCENISESRKVFKESGDLRSNCIWIKKLLEWYYDPTYKKIYKVAKEKQHK